MASTADPTAAPVTSSGPLDAGRAAGRAASEGVPGAWIVGTIALLVVLVSLPRFRAHVLEANRKDARLTLALISQRVFEPEWQSALPEGTAPGDLYSVIQIDDRLRHRFPDARQPEGRHELLHHGYLFDTGHVVIDGLRTPALVAWPDLFGRTGDLAFARTGDGAVYVHANEGLWSGAGSVLMDADLADEGWRRISAPTAPR